MACFTPGIRRAIAIWCTLALPLVGWSVVAGSRPLTTALLFVTCTLAAGTVAGLVGFGAEPQTAARLLCDEPGADRQ